MRIRPLELSFYFLLMMMLPPLINNMLSAESVAPGILMFSALLLVSLPLRFGINRLCFSNSNIKYVLFVFLLLIISSANSFFVYGELKPIYSTAFIFVILAALVFSSLMVSLNYQALNTAIKNSIFVLFFVGYISLIWKPSILGYSDVHKSVFPFSEQSHFSLALGVFVCAYVVNCRLQRSFWLIVILLLLSFLFPSLTLLVFSLLAIIIATVRLRKRSIYIAFALMSCSSLVAIFYLIRDISYFSDRLSFSDSQNLTTLVYIQGWQLAYENFNIAQLFGLGYQMLGQSTTTLATVSSEILKLTNSNYLNLEDGGFMAAKIISEFGIIGLIFTIWYLYYLFWYFKNINDVKNIGYKNFDTNEIQKLRCLMTIAFASLVEFFFRGVGYFSPNFMLFLVSLFSINQIAHGSKDNSLLKASWKSS